MEAPLNLVPCDTILSRREIANDFLAGEHEEVVANRANLEIHPQLWVRCLVSCLVSSNEFLAYVPPDCRHTVRNRQLGT